MNWLNDFLNDSKLNLPFEIPKEASDKLNSYVTLFKDKTNELKQSVSEQVKEFGSQTQTKTMPSDIKFDNQSAAGNERVVQRSQTAQRNSAEVNHTAVSTKVERVKYEEAKEMVVRYKIKVRRTEGEVKLPKGASEQEIREAILTHSGVTITTKVDTGTSGGKSSFALTGFNSYASLFGKF